MMSEANHRFPHSLSHSVLEVCLYLASRYQLLVYVLQVGEDLRDSLSPVLREVSPLFRGRYPPRFAGYTTSLPYWKVIRFHGSAVRW